MRVLKMAMVFIGALYSLIGLCDVPNQVNMHFTGNVIARPCSVSIGATTTLDVGDIDLGQFIKSGATSAWVNYNVRFFACDIQTNIVLSGSAQNVLSPDQGKGFSVYDNNSGMLEMGMHLDAYTTIDGKDMNLLYTYAGFGLPPLVITPIQRAISDLTSYDVPLKFRFVNFNNKNPGAVYGIFVLAIDYK